VFFSSKNEPGEPVSDIRFSFWLTLDLCATVAGPTNGRLDRASDGAHQQQAREVAACNQQYGYREEESADQRASPSYGVLPQADAPRR